MFGGITFMVNGKMCISVGPNRLMCRIDPELHERAIEREGVRTVKMNGCVSGLRSRARGCSGVHTRPELLGESVP